MTLTYNTVRTLSEAVVAKSADLVQLWIEIHRLVEYANDANVNWTPATKTFTADNTTDTMTSTAHGLLNGQKARITTAGTIPAGLAVGTDYWLVGVAANTFQLAATLGGAAINFTSNGAGTLTLNPVPDWITEASNGNLIDKDFSRADVANALGSLDQFRNLMTNVAVTQGDHLGNFDKLIPPS